MRPLAMLLLATAALPQIEAPRAGVIRDRAGVLRPVYGVAGSFVLGEPLADEVLSAGFSRSDGFAKTASELIVFHDGKEVDRVPAPPGPARFVFSPQPAAYFPATGELWSAKTRRSESAAPPEETVRCESDEVVLPGGERVRLPEPVAGIEWMSEHWVIARGDAALYAVRVNGNSHTVVQLPEPAAQ